MTTDSWKVVKKCMRGLRYPLPSGGEWAVKLNIIPLRLFVKIKNKMDIKLENALSRQNHLSHVRKTKSCLFHECG